MKVYASYENGYKEQQVAVKETAQVLINEAIAARLNNGKIKADELALYGAIMEEAEVAVAYARKQYVEKQEGKR